MTIESVDAALRLAIEREEQARAFYTAWGARSRDPGAGALLRELAAQEVTHRERLERGLPLAQAGGAGPPPADLHLADSLVEQDPSPDATTQDVLIVAIKREVRAHEMYTQLAKWVADAGLRDLMTALAGEEAQHRARLEALYDDIVLTDD